LRNKGEGAPTTHTLKLFHSVQAASKADFPFMVLNPLARWRIFWDLTVMLLVVYNLIMVVPLANPLNPQPPPLSLDRFCLAGLYFDQEVQISETLVRIRRFDQSSNPPPWLVGEDCDVVGGQVARPAWRALGVQV
jgi:hypothetical protein